MSTLYVAQVIADERGAELQRRADTARLAALARCCRPSTWARAARRAAAAVDRLRTARSAGTPCCAPA
ncbi:hypothetical protein ACI797_10645 [Geodermatophilus sp. SYSU D00691]